MSVKCLIYCTKSKPYISYDSYDNKIWETDREYSLNGKIVAQFDCEKVEKFDVPYPAYFCEVKDKLEHITKGSCLSLLNLHHYMKNQKGYAIHISNLKIFDNPKQLSDYVYLTCGYEQCSKCKYYYTWGECVPQEFELEKAPQNMMNVWKKRNIFTELSERKKEHYVLISIRPEWVAKILTGEKIIEVRRKILNCLQDLI